MFFCVGDRVEIKATRLWGATIPAELGVIERIDDERIAVVNVGEGRKRLVYISELNEECPHIRLVGPEVTEARGTCH